MAEKTLVDGLTVWQPMSGQTVASFRKEKDHSCNHELVLVLYQQSTHFTLLILLLEPLILLMVPQLGVVGEDEVGHLVDPLVGDGELGEEVAIHQAAGPPVTKS